MDYNQLEKDDLKGIIGENASIKNYELSKGWQNKSFENLVLLAEEIDEFQPEVEEEKKVVVGKGKVKNGLSYWKKKILAQPRVMVEVPIDELNEESTHINIWVNGLEFIYARGQAYEMPQSVAEVYLNSKKETAKVKKRMREFIEIDY